MQASEEVEISKHELLRTIKEMGRKNLLLAQKVVKVGQLESEKLCSDAFIKNIQKRKQEGASEELKFECQQFIDDLLNEENQLDRTYNKCKRHVKRQSICSLKFDEQYDFLTDFSRMTTTSDTRDPIEYIESLSSTINLMRCYQQYFFNKTNNFLEKLVGPKQEFKKSRQQLMDEIEQLKEELSQSTCVFENKEIVISLKFKSTPSSKEYDIEEIQKTISKCIQTKNKVNRLGYLQIDAETTRAPVSVPVSVTNKSMDVNTMSKRLDALAKCMQNDGSKSRRDRRRSCSKQRQIVLEEQNY